MQHSLFALALLLGASTARAQITPEKQYARPVEAFKLSTGEVRYATYTPGPTNQVRVYAQSHALVQQITVPVAASAYATIDYLSDKLFNTTPDLEFLLYVSPGVTGQLSYAQVFSSAGLSLLKVDSSTYVNIFTSPAGTKLVTYQANASLSDSYSRVYALPGTPAPLGVAAGPATPDPALPYPNPTSERIRLPYSVAAGQVGTLVISDAAGRQVQQAQVDATFDHLLLDARSLRPGAYLYRVQVGGATSPARRFVVQ